MLELARESDFEEVRRLSVQVHELHVAWRPDIFFSCDEPYPKENFLRDIAARMVYVAKIRNIIVGYVVLSTVSKGGAGVVEKKLLRLDSIVVDESCRGQGIGKAMITDVRALARVFGCKQLILSVHPENDGAVAFYQKCGFYIRSIQMDSNA